MFAWEPSFITFFTHWVTFDMWTIPAPENDADPVQYLRFCLDFAKIA